MSDFEGTQDNSSVAENEATETQDSSLDYEALSSSFEDNSQEDNSQEDNSSSNESGRNPAWDPILELIPEQLHEKVIPHLSKTDKHVQELQQKYAPYKSFVDNGINPEALQASFELGQAISANPRAVYDQMREQFGFTHEEAMDAINEHSEDDDESQGFEEYGDEEDGEDYGAAIENHPLVQQLQQQVEELNAMREQQAHEEMRFNIEQEVNREWAEVEQRAGGRLPDNVKEDIMQRALHLAGENGMPRLMDGFEAHVKFVSQIRNSSANNSAPSVSDGQGLLPASKVYDNSTAEGRQKKIADMVRSLNAQAANGG